MGLLVFASIVAVYAIFALAAMGMDSSYIIPIACKMIFQDHPGKRANLFPSMRLPRLTRNPVAFQRGPIQTWTFPPWPRSSQLDCQRHRSRLDIVRRHHPRASDDPTR